MKKVVVLIALLASSVPSSSQSSPDYRFDTGPLYSDVSTRIVSLLFDGISFSNAPAHHPVLGTSGSQRFEPGAGSILGAGLIGLVLLRLRRFRALTGSLGRRAPSTTGSGVAPSERRARATRSSANSYGPLPTHFRRSS
jgi:hypothetical protein